MDLVNVLSLRKQLAKSSTKKLDAFKERAVDGVLRHNFKYYGAHTGRWSGQGVQLQNLPRPTISDVESATEAIRRGEDLNAYGQPMDVISSCLRSALRSEFAIADESQIELRALAWITNCRKMLSGFAAGIDQYTAFASRMYGIPVDKVTKHQRQIAKSAVLGCGFQLSGGEEEEDRNGDLVKTGLWGYAAAMGIDMTHDESHDAVRVFRSEYPEIKNFWYEIEDQAKQAIMNPGITRTCRMFKLTFPERHLQIALPSGRSLFYPYAKIVQGHWNDGSPKTSISYRGVDPRTKKFSRIMTYGGRLTENLCQAVARDVLAEAMLRADKAGLEIVLHAHDEIGVLGNETDLAILEMCMTENISWAPGLLLKADGYVSRIYKK